MSQGTIIMLALIVVVIFGGSILLVRRILDHEGKNTPKSTMSSCRRSH